jgi:hypothetical protein
LGGVQLLRGTLKRSQLNDPIESLELFQRNHGTHPPTSDISKSDVVQSH